MASTLKYTNKLAKRNVLVLGGTSGIGFCVAEAALEQGASVVISGSSEEKLQNAIRRLRTSYPSSSSNITGYTCDLSNSTTQETNLRNLLQAATTRAKLDHVVFTAGDALKLTPISEITAESILRAGTVRFVGPAILAKILPDFIVPGPESSFTLTSGVLATKPSPGYSILAGWGSAVEGLMRGLAVDLQPLRVNLVSPGAVHTELFNNFGTQRLPALLKSFADATLTGVVAKPEDCAEAYVYIMKDYGITGSVLGTNGGYLLK